MTMPNRERAELLKKEVDGAYSESWDLQARAQVFNKAFLATVLEILKEETEGNLDDDETRMFTDVLSSLQMTYVETARAEGAEETAGQGETEEASKAENNDTPPEETAENTPGASADGETKEPKYHKSYGDG